MKKLERQTIKLINIIEGNTPPITSKIEICPRLSEIFINAEGYSREFGVPPFKLKHAIQVAKFFKRPWRFGIKEFHITVKFFYQC